MASEGNEHKKIVLFRKEQLQVTCEWNECHESHTNMDEFLRHIKMHLECHQSDDLNCHWQECGHMSGSLQEFVIHVNFHGFHAKLKCLGGNLLARKGLKACCLNSNNRNLLPELPEKLICCWTDCGEVFNNPEVFYRHVDYHVDDVSRQEVKCLWEGCLGKFNTTSKLRDHFRSHTQEKLVACQTCGGLFSSRTKFFDHLKRQMPIEDQQYQCSHCSKRLASERLLRDHMRNHINHYKCPCCDMTCSNPSNLRNHMKYRHDAERPFACNYCDYGGKSQSDLCKHLRTHLSEPQHKCTHGDCSFTTRTELSLKMHISKEHKKVELSRYCCHMCEKTYARGATLTRHLFTKHKFRWPSGHSRFRYKQNSDGTRQLQTIRYESIELTQEMIDQKSEPDSKMKNFKDTSNEECLELFIDIESEEVGLPQKESDEISIDIESEGAGLPEKEVFEASSTKSKV